MAKENKGKQSIMDAIMNDKMGVEDALKESNSFDAEIREMAESQLKEEEKKAKEREERAKRLAQLLEKQEKAASQDKELNEGELEEFKELQRPNRLSSHLTPPSPASSLAGCGSR